MDIQKRRNEIIDTLENNLDYIRLYAILLVNKKAVVKEYSKQVNIGFSRNGDITFGVYSVMKANNISVDISVKQGYVEICENVETFSLERYISEYVVVTRFHTIEEFISEARLNKNVIDALLSEKMDETFSFHQIKNGLPLYLYASELNDLVTDKNNEPIEVTDIASWRTALIGRNERLKSEAMNQFVEEDFTHNADIVEMELVENEFDFTSKWLKTATFNELLQYMDFEMIYFIREKNVGASIEVIRVVPTEKSKTISTATFINAALKIAMKDMYRNHLYLYYTEEKIENPIETVQTFYCKADQRKNVRVVISSTGEVSVYSIVEKQMPSVIPHVWHLEQTFINLEDYFEQAKQVSDVRGGFLVG